MYNRNPLKQAFLRQTKHPLHRERSVPIYSAGHGNFLRTYSPDISTVMEDLELHSSRADASM